MKGRRERKKGVGCWEQGNKGGMRQSWRENPIKTRSINSLIQFNHSLIQLIDSIH